MILSQPTPFPPITALVLAALQTLMQFLQKGGRIMAMQKIYAGTSLRETRGRSGLTQRRFAERRGGSLP